MDAFICYPPSGKYSNVDQWLAQRSSTKNFDRTMFIADQPKPNVPFLLAFMETQSFVSFVDSKIASRFNEDNQFFGLSHKHLQVRFGFLLFEIEFFFVVSFLLIVFVYIEINVI